MVNRDSRYDLIKPLIATGKIVGFNDIFKYIPKTVVAIDLGKKVDRFTALMNKVESFTFTEVFIIAKFCEISEPEMIKLIMHDYFKNKNKIAKPIKSL